MGDVCVSPLSVDWVCKKASWSQQCQGYPNVCSLPQEAAGPDAAELYGQCIFSAAAQHSLALADELLAAAKGPYAQLKVRVAWVLYAGVRRCSMVRRCCEGSAGAAAYARHA
jgi:hypothetical protein